MKQHLVSNSANSKFKKIKEAILKKEDISISVYSVNIPYAIEGAIISKNYDSLTWNHRK